MPRFFWWIWPSIFGSFLESFLGTLNAKHMEEWKWKENNSCQNESKFEWQYFLGILGSCLNLRIKHIPVNVNLLRKFFEIRWPRYIFDIVDVNSPAFPLSLFLFGLDFCAVQKENKFCNSMILHLQLSLIQFCCNKCYDLYLDVWSGQLFGYFHQTLDWHQCVTVLKMLNNIDS